MLVPRRVTLFMMFDKEVSAIKHPGQIDERLVVRRSCYQTCLILTCCEGGQRGEATMAVHSLDNR